MMKKTGAYITAKRIEKDISEEELAKNLNVTVTQVESGSGEISSLEFYSWNHFVVCLAAMSRNFYRETMRPVQMCWS